MTTTFNIRILEAFELLYPGIRELISTSKEFGCGNNCPACRVERIAELEVENAKLKKKIKK